MRTFRRVLGVWNLLTVGAEGSVELRGTEPIRWERVGELRKNREDARTRQTLTCKLCGLSVVVREETLHPILDKLAASGASTVTLRTFGMLGSS